MKHAPSADRVGFLLLSQHGDESFLAGSVGAIR